ncbi:MAG TPA: VOC family protein [Pseudonocardiaceae bacterium]|jgi:predicted lactoylglutathione lyase|nr:VOC family protein [Pseudonocardiaceae bacterium]
MSRTIFVNLPVHDLTKAVDFFAAVGFTADPMATGADTTRMIVGDECSVMLHTEKSFQSYAQCDITDTKTSREVIVGVSATSRTEVDDLVARAVAAGGTALGEAQDQGFMYMWGFRDVDGHQWSFLFLDASVVGAA